jgi:hypothetical protein
VLTQMLELPPLIKEVREARVGSLELNNTILDFFYGERAKQRRAIVDAPSQVFDNAFTLVPPNWYMSLYRYDPKDGMWDCELSHTRPGMGSIKAAHSDRVLVLVLAILLVYQIENLWRFQDA